MLGKVVRTGLLVVGRLGVGAVLNLLHIWQEEHGEEQGVHPFL
jgi:hypothetical protein